MKRLNYLIEKYNKRKYDMEMEFNNEGAVFKYIRKVFDTLNNNKGKFTRIIMDGVMRVLSSSLESIQNEDMNEFSKYISEQMLNMSMRFKKMKENAGIPRMY